MQGWVSGWIDDRWTCDTVSKTQQLFSDHQISSCWPFPYSRLHQEFRTTQMSACDTKWWHVLLTLYISLPEAVCFFPGSAAFHILQMETDSGGSTQTQRLAPHLRPHSKQCQENDVAAVVSLILMKIAGWQGGCHLCPLNHRQLQVIRACCHAAVVCGNCKMLLKSPGEWL